MATTQLASTLKQLRKTHGMKTAGERVGVLTDGNKAGYLQVLEERVMRLAL